MIRYFRTKPILQDLQNFFVSFSVKCRFCNHPSFFDRYGPEGYLHFRHQNRAHTELIHTQPHQKRSAEGISGHLAADANPDTILFSYFYRSIDQPEKTGVKMLKEM